MHHTEAAQTDAAIRPGQDEWREHAVATNPSGALVWMLSMALLFAGFGLMGMSFQYDNGVLFAAGIVTSSLAFLIPLQVRERKTR